MPRSGSNNDGKDSPVTEQQLMILRCLERDADAATATYKAVEQELVEIKTHGFRADIEAAQEKVNEARAALDYPADL